MDSDRADFSTLQYAFQHLHFDRLLQDFLPYALIEPRPAVAVYQRQGFTMPNRIPDTWAVAVIFPLLLRVTFVQVLHQETALGDLGGSDRVAFFDPRQSPAPRYNCLEVLIAQVEHVY